MSTFGNCLYHLCRWCKPDCVHHLWRWKCGPKYRHIKFRCQGITHKKEYNLEHGQSLRKGITWPYCLDMLRVRINATGERGLLPGNLALQEEILLLDCYMTAKSRKYVILLAKGLHDWRESLWLKVFVIGINVTCPIHNITKEIHGTESLYISSISCRLLCPQGRLDNCSFNCPTASLAYGRIVGNFRLLVGTFQSEGFTRSVNIKSDMDQSWNSGCVQMWSAKNGTWWIGQLLICIMDCPDINKK